MGDAEKLSPEEMRYYRIRKTVCKMLAKRGYTVSHEVMEQSMAEFKESIQVKFETKIKEACSLLVQKPDNPSDQVMVTFAEDDKTLGTKSIKVFASKMLDTACSSGILIYKNNITAIARQLLQPGAIAEVKIEVFRESELLVDITEHELVPEHVVLTQEQKQEVLQRYKLKESQLPKIQQADPVARYYGLTRGQVVKITRLSETAGRYVTYRVCV